MTTGGYHGQTYSQAPPALPSLTVNKLVSPVLPQSTMDCCLERAGGLPEVTQQQGLAPEMLSLHFLALPSPRPSVLFLCSPTPAIPHPTGGGRKAQALCWGDGGVLCLWTQSAPRVWEGKVGGWVALGLHPSGQEQREGRSNLRESSLCVKGAAWSSPWSPECYFLYLPRPPTITPPPKTPPPHTHT